MAAIYNRGRAEPLHEDLQKVERLFVPLAKIASLVVVAVSLLFVVYFPNFFTFGLAAGLGFAAWDVFKMGNDLVSLLHDPIRFARGDNDSRYATDEVTKRAYLLGPILRIILEYQRH